MYEWDGVLSQATAAVNLSSTYQLIVQQEYACMDPHSFPFIFSHGRVPNLLIDKELGLGTIVKAKSRTTGYTRCVRLLIWQERHCSRQDEDEHKFKKGEAEAIYKEWVVDKVGARWQQGFWIEDEIPSTGWIFSNKGRFRLGLSKGHIKRDFSLGVWERYSEYSY